MSKSPEELIAEFKKRGNNEKIKPATDAERDQLRTEFEQVCKLPGKASQIRSLHIPDSDDNPICENHINNRNRSMGDREYMLRCVSKFPRGHNDWCKHCLKKWRDGHE